LHVDPQYDATFPGQRGARVEVTMRGGERFEHRQETRKGDPDDPLSDAELDSKFMELAGAAVGSAAARRFLVELHALEERPDAELFAPQERTSRPTRPGKRIEPAISIV
jgi:2-methylcitrate dehydratase PrpD